MTAFKLSAAQRALARGHVWFALASPRLEPASLRVAQAALYLAFADDLIASLPPVPPNKAGAGLPRSQMERYRAQYRREWARLSQRAPAPKVSPGDKRRIVDVLRALGASAEAQTLTEYRRHLKGLSSSLSNAPGRGLLDEWPVERIGQLLAVLYQVNVLTGAGPEYRLLVDDGERRPKRLNATAAAFFFPELARGAPPSEKKPPERKESTVSAAPVAFSVATFRKQVHHAAPKERQAAWRALAHHNLAAPRPAGIAQLLPLWPANERTRDSALGLLTEKGRLHAPHPRLKYVVKDPDSATGRLALMALCTLDKSPYLPHLKKILDWPLERLRSGKEDWADKEAALAGLWLYAQRSRAARSLWSLHWERVPRTVQVAVRKLLDRQKLPQPNGAASA